MIHISYRVSGGVIKVAASGHACFAPAGQDVVCAAISALLQTLVLYTQGKKGGSAETGKGVLHVAMRDGKEPRAVAEAVMAGVRQIAKQYPECVQMK